MAVKFQIALRPKNAVKALLEGKSWGEAGWVIPMLLAGDGSTGPSVDALPVLVPQLVPGAHQKTPLTELGKESGGQSGRT